MALTPRLAPAPAPTLGLTPLEGPFRLAANLLGPAVAAEVLTGGRLGAAAGLGATAGLAGGAPGLALEAVEVVLELEFALEALVVRLVDWARVERVDNVADGLRVVVGTKPPEGLRWDERSAGPPEAEAEAEAERVDDTLRLAGAGAGASGDEGSFRLARLSEGMPVGLPGDGCGRGIRESPDEGGWDVSEMRGSVVRLTTFS